MSEVYSLLSYENGEYTNDADSHVRFKKYGQRESKSDVMPPVITGTRTP